MHRRFPYHLPALSFALLFIIGVSSPLLDVFCDMEMKQEMHQICSSESVSSQMHDVPEMEMPQSAHSDCCCIKRASSEEMPFRAAVVPGQQSSSQLLAHASPDQTVLSVVDDGQPSHLTGYGGHSPPTPVPLFLLNNTFLN